MSASGGISGLGVGISAAGVMLILSAWRNWTIADTVRNVAALTRGGSLPPAGETSLTGIAGYIGPLKAGKPRAPKVHVPRVTGTRNQRAV